MPAEFAEVLAMVFAACMEVGELTNNMKDGLIVLLFKGGDPRNLKNILMRPVTLVNVTLPVSLPRLPGHTIEQMSEHDTVGATWCYGLSEVIAAHGSLIRGTQSEDTHSLEVYWTLARIQTIESQHEWFYFSEMLSTEAIIFINWDSDETASQFVFHGALQVADEPRYAGLGGSGPAVPPVRRSLEVRVLVMIDKFTG